MAWLTFDLFSLFEQAFNFLTADLFPVTASLTFPLSHSGGLLDCFVFFLNYNTYFIWAPNTIFFKRLQDAYRLLIFRLFLLGYGVVFLFVCFSRSIALFFCNLFYFVFYLWETCSLEKLIGDSRSLLESLEEWMDKNQRAALSHSEQQSRYCYYQSLFYCFWINPKLFFLIFSFPPVSCYAHCSFRCSPNRSHFLYIFYVL